MTTSALCFELKSSEIPITCHFLDQPALTLCVFLLAGYKHLHNVRVSLARQPGAILAAGRARACFTRAAKSLTDVVTFSPLVRLLSREASSDCPGRPPPPPLVCRSHLVLASHPKRLMTGAFSSERINYSLMTERLEVSAGR